MTYRRYDVANMQSLAFLIKTCLHEHFVIRHSPAIFIYYIFTVKKKSLDPETVLTTSGVRGAIKMYVTQCSKNMFDLNQQLSVFVWISLYFFRASVDRSGFQVTDPITNTRWTTRGSHNHQISTQTLLYDIIELKRAYITLSISRTSWHIGQREEMINSIQSNPTKHT